MQKQSLAVSTTMIIALVLATAVAAVAADPIIGTWKLNVAKSKFSHVLLADQKQAAPKEGMEVYREIEGDQIEFTSKGTRTDGSSDSTKWTWPRQGGLVRRLDAPLPAETIYVETVAEPGNWYVTILQKGKQVRLIHKIFSKDGKTMTQTLTGADAQGKPFEQVQVFDRQ
jgi:hypothetical protein